MCVCVCLYIVNNGNKSDSMKKIEKSNPKQMINSSLMDYFVFLFSLYTHTHIYMVGVCSYLSVFVCSYSSVYLNMFISILFDF